MIMNKKLCREHIEDVIQMVDSLAFTGAIMDDEANEIIAKLS